MWPYTEEENAFISEEKRQSESEWDYDTYGHGA